MDNVPQVGPERLEKLKNVIHKIFSKFGKINTEFYPEADGLTKGYGICSIRRVTRLVVGRNRLNKPTSPAGTSSWSMAAPARPWRR